MDTPFALHAAIEAGDAEKVARLLSETSGDGEFDPAAFGDGDEDDYAFGSDALGAVARRDGLDRAPVHVAILNKQAACLEQLVGAGASVNTRLDGMNLLCFLCACSISPSWTEFACKASEILVAAGASLAAADANGRTPLHWCSFNGQLALLKSIETAAKAKAEAEKGGAASSGGELPDFIKNETDPARKAILMEEYGPGAAAAAPADEEPEAFEVNAHDSQGATALHIAADRGHIEVVNWLISDKKASADVADVEGMRAAHRAAACGHESCLRALLPAMADPKARDEMGRSIGDVLTQRKRTAAPGSSEPPAPVQVVWTPSSGRHLTSPAAPPGTAASLKERGAAPQPDNPERVTVLLHPGYGVLRSGAFVSGPNALEWVRAEPAAMPDVLRVHEYAYVRRLMRACADAATDSDKLNSGVEPEALAAALESGARAYVVGNPGAKLGHAVRLLDSDTSVSAESFDAALGAAGAACRAVDQVVSGRARSVFCPVRPPGHHAGPMGRVTCSNERNGSLGFCLLNNVAIAAAYARATYGRDTKSDTAVRRVVIIDFDVHHGNGTEAAVRNLRPSTLRAMIQTPFASATLETDSYKPWLDGSDGRDTLFVSTHGYGHQDPTAALAKAAADGTLAELVAGTAPAKPAPTAAAASSSALEQLASTSASRGASWFYPGSGANSGYEGLPSGIEPLVEGTLARSKVRISDPDSADQAEAKPPPSSSSSSSSSSAAGAGLYSGQAPPAGAPASAPIAATDLDDAARAASSEGLGTGGCVEEETQVAGEPASSSPAVINVGLPVGYSRADWRDVMATSVLPRIAAFQPDLVLISAGFDGHAEDVMNHDYGVLREDDYAWVTRHLCGLAKGGRVVSVLEGGYAISAGPASPFARAVAAHVEALTACSAPVQPGGGLAPAGWAWDAALVLAEAAGFRSGHARLEAEEAARRKAEGLDEDGEDAEDGAAAAAATSSSSSSSSSSAAAAADEPMPEDIARALAEDAEAVDTENYGRGGRRKRGRAVDYSKLNEKLDEEEGPDPEASAADAKREKHQDEDGDDSDDDDADDAGFDEEDGDDDEVDDNDDE